MTYEDVHELMAGFQSITQQINGLAMQRTLTGASEAVQQIKDSELDEHEKKMRIRAIANQSAMQMMGQNQPLDKIQIAMQSISPPMSQEEVMDKSAAIEDSQMQKRYAFEDMKLNKQMAGAEEQDKRRYMRELGMQGLKFKQAKELAEMKYGHWETKAENEVPGMSKYLSGSPAQRGSDSVETSSAAAARAPKMKKVWVPNPGANKKSDADISFETNVDVGLQSAKNLKSVVKDVGNWETYLGNQKAKAALESEAYNLAIVYSKIVDPATAAREGEVAAAQKYAIPMGLTVKNSQTLAAIDLYEKKIKEYKEARKRAKVSGQPLPDEQQQSGDSGLDFLE